MNNLDTHAISPTAARITGWALVIAPILLLASTVAYIAHGAGINDGVLGGTIGVWSGFAFIVAFAGLLRLVEPTAPRAAPILALIAATGWAAGIAFNVQAIFVSLFGPDIDQFMDTVDGTDSLAILAFLPWGWFAPISLLAIGILLWRTDIVPRTSSALLIAGAVLFLASRPARIDPVAVLADCVVILALAPIGWAILTGRHDVGRLSPPDRSRGDTADRDQQTSSIDSRREPARPTEEFTT